MAIGKRKRGQQARQTVQRRRRLVQRVASAVLAIGATSAFLLSRPPEAEPISQERASAVHSKGADDAAVTIIEYGDFDCPACKLYLETGIIERVLAEYVGEVRFESRRYRCLVRDQLREAASIGFRGTPFFVVNDTQLAGPPMYATLAEIIEASSATD